MKFPRLCITLYIKNIYEILSDPVVDELKRLNIIQSTLVISTSVISNNWLSRRENLVLVLTQKNQNIKYCGKEEKLLLGAISPLFYNIFNINF